MTLNLGIHSLVICVDNSATRDKNPKSGFSEGILMREQRLSIAAMVTLIVILFVGIAYAAILEGVLHSFNPGHEYDGWEPLAGLIVDAAGHLYGTTRFGGTIGEGTVFEMKYSRLRGWTEKILYNFNPTQNNDGSEPYAGLVFDTAGNLYGTTAGGGAYGNYGTVFELTPNGSGGWTEVILHSFNNDGKDGYGPIAGLTFDTTGNLYGTTASGGTFGSGTVFGMSPRSGGGWQEAVLHSFNNDRKDGYQPFAGLVIDAAGNLYGTTFSGGTYGGGTVFGMRPRAGGGWEEGVLHSFSEDGEDGTNPWGGLIFDAEGDLYGTTAYGGTDDCGTVFGLRPKAGGYWQEGVLYSFYTKPNDGCSPVAGLIFDASGNLYGTTNYGGIGCGTVFGLKPKAGGGWVEGVLHSFKNSSDGCEPSAGLTLDAAGNLYGTTKAGGNYNYGTVFGVEP
jgi:uncharacterized repeat protein (TIGR03803 family)